MKTIINIHCIESENEVKFFFENREIVPWLTKVEIEQLQKMFTNEALGSWRIEL